MKIRLIRKVLRLLFQIFQIFYLQEALQLTDKTHKHKFKQRDRTGCVRIQHIRRKTSDYNPGRKILQG